MNVGKVIKIISIILFFVFTISTMLICTFIYKEIDYDNSSIYLFITIVASLIVSFILSLLIYGFGDLIDTNRQILKKLKN